MTDEIAYLTEGLSAALTKKVAEEGMMLNRSASVCYSTSGRKYRGANVGSDTNLLSVSSEQSALVVAVAHQDYDIKEIVTLIEDGSDFVLNPITAKVMIDFCVRTGGTITYRVIDTKGITLLESSDVRELIPLYTPRTQILAKTHMSTPRIAKVPLYKNTPLPDLLKTYAREGLASSFPTYDTASGYGAAVATKDAVYFTGQYSSFEKRSGLHAEMAAVVLALMDNNQKITSLGLVSTKYTDTPCEICGCCRQFLAEVSTRYGLYISLHCFAKDTDVTTHYTLSDILPNQWSSKKW